MNKSIGIQLIVYSLLLAGLSYAVHHLAPGLARPTLITGLAGGALCLVYGARAIAGSRSKPLPLLTLIAVGLVLLSQTIAGWSEAGSGTQSGSVGAALITLLLVLTLVMLVRIAWSGVVFDLQAPNPTQDEATKPSAAGSRAVQAKAGSRA